MLAVALIEVRRGLRNISQGLATLGDALDGVESEHLRPLEPAVKAINAQFDMILSALPGIARQGRGRGREEAAMTLWWILDLVLLLVVVPVVVDPAPRRAQRGARHRPERQADHRRGQAGPRTSTPSRCC